MHCSTLRTHLAPKNSAKQAHCAPLFMANNGKEVLPSRVDIGKVYLTPACCFYCTAHVLSFRGILSCYSDLRSSVLAIVQCHSLTQAEIQMPQASTIQASLPRTKGIIHRQRSWLCMPGLALHCYPVMYSWCLAAWLA